MAPNPGPGSNLDPKLGWGKRVMSSGIQLEASLSQPMLKTRVWEDMETDPSKEETPGRSILPFKDEDSVWRWKLCLWK